MRNLTDVRIRRGLLVLAAVLLCLAVAGPVQAKDEKVNFKPGIDISSWYWSQQRDQEVTTPPGVPPPLPTCVPAPPPVGTTCNAPPVSNRTRGPNSYRADTLPVSMAQGQPERKAAIKFDLLERGVTEGSKIKKLLLFIEEKPTEPPCDPSSRSCEPPQARPETATIQACRILEFLTQGENEEFADAPKIDDKECVDGTREAVAGAAAVWTFDLTKLADAWAKDPYENHGVMLQGTGTNTWAVHLKVPRTDSPALEGDQYEMTKNRAFVTISFIPGEPPEIPDVPDVPDAPPAPSDTGTSSAFTSSGTPPIPASTDFTGEESGIPGADPMPPPTAPTEQAGFFFPGEQGPRMPAYVWLGIPLALLALAAVRSVVLEPVGGPRPDGVISAIRRRNAERRGVALVAGQGVLGRMSTGLKRGLGGIGSGFSSLKRSVRRKR